MCSTYQKLSKIFIGNIGEFDTMELGDDELREAEFGQPLVYRFQVRVQAYWEPKCIVLSET